jgi:hypothetical protein
MEPDQEGIARDMQATGTTEDEARILIHLKAAKEGFFDLPGNMSSGQGWAISYHFDARARMIASRVAEREYPEGWHFTKEPYNEDEDVPPLA